MRDDPKEFLIFLFNKYENEEYCFDEVFEAD